MKIDICWLFKNFHYFKHHEDGYMIGVGLKSEVTSRSI